jgi:hypothetical protein
VRICDRCGHWAAGIHVIEKSSNCYHVTLLESFSASDVVLVAGGLIDQLDIYLYRPFRAISRLTG